MQNDQSSPRSRHILVDGYGANQEALSDRALIENALRAAVEIGEVTLLKLTCHVFDPQGITAFALLTESHIAIHTWPEQEFFTADLYFCGGKIDSALDALLATIRPQQVRTTEIARGGGSELSGNGTRTLNYKESATSALGNSSNLRTLRY